MAAQAAAGFGVAMGDQPHRRIVPVILSGGSGSRLWPLSREKTPKPLLKLLGAETLLQRTALRVADSEFFAPLIVIAGSAQRAEIAGQLDAVGATTDAIVLEPSPRNTAAAIAVAALYVAQSQPDGLILVMPSDHAIADVAGFQDAVRRGVEAAASGHLTLFGIGPDRPATGYGYIHRGDPLSPGSEASRVAAFVEKPDRATAEAYVGSGDYLWNSGIFLMPVAALLAEFRSYEPDLLGAAEEAVARASRDKGFLQLDATAFGRCRSISIDHAIMERTEKAAVVNARFDWSDVGSWMALWSLADRDAAGNAVFGDVLTLSTQNSYVRSDAPLVATIGVRDLIVVATKDAVLVAHKDSDQDIREIVERLRRGGSPLL